MAHEKTIGLGFDGKEHVFPSVDPKTGKQMSPGEVGRRFRAGTLKPLRILPSVKTGKTFAERRSQGFGRPLNPSATRRKALSNSPFK